MRFTFLPKERMEVLEGWTRHDGRVVVARRRMREVLLVRRVRCILEMGWG